MGVDLAGAHFHHIHIVKHDAPPILLLVVEHRQCNMHALVHVARITPPDLERWLHQLLITLVNESEWARIAHRLFHGRELNATQRSLKK